MPKSFLIKKILGLDDDQSVPTLKLEDTSCEDLSLEDSVENAKRSPPVAFTGPQGNSLLHYPEYMNRSFAFRSYLLSQKHYLPPASFSICYCKECLSGYRPAAIDRNLLPIYHNPFLSNQGDQGNTSPPFNYNGSLPLKRSYPNYEISKSTEDIRAKLKVRVIESDKTVAHSPAAIVPEMKRGSVSSPTLKDNEARLRSKTREVEDEDGSYQSEESLDSFSNESSDGVSSYSGSRRSSAQSLEDSESKDGSESGKSKEFSCGHCPMTFARSSDLQRHSLIHSKEKPYVCYICERGFTWFGNFQKHVLSHDGDYKVYHPLLFMKNTTEEDLIIRDGANFKCKLCQKQFTRMSGLRTHVRMHTGQRPFKCTTCSFAFTTSRALKMHMRIHTGERPYKCDECPKAFTRRDELQAHIYMHKGEKPFKCDQCSSAFIRYGHLQRHLLTHSADKPYKCKWCTKSFTQYRNLQTHTYKHTGERPFKCNFCGKGFTQYGTLQAHERTHTGKKPFQCKDCDKAFITSSHLRWHMKRHHNDDKTSFVSEENK